MPVYEIYEEYMYGGDIYVRSIDEWGGWWRRGYLKQRRRYIRKWLWPKLPRYPTPPLVGASRDLTS